MASIGISAGKGMAGEADRISPFRWRSGNSEVVMKRRPEDVLERKERWGDNGSFELGPERHGDDSETTPVPGSKSKGKERQRRQSSIQLISPTTLKAPGEPSFPRRLGLEGEEENLLPGPRSRRSSSAAVESLERQAHILAITERLATALPQPKGKHKASRSLSQVAHDARRAAQRSSSRGREAGLPPELRMTQTQAQSQTKETPRKDSSRNGQDDVSEDAGGEQREQEPASPKEKREKLFEKLGITGLGGTDRKSPNVRRHAEHTRGAEVAENVVPTAAAPTPSSADTSEQPPSNVTSLQPPPGPPPAIPPRPAGRRGHRRSEAVDLRKPSETATSTVTVGASAVPRLELPPAAHLRSSDDHARRHSSSGEAVTGQKGQNAGLGDVERKGSRGGDDGERA